LIIACIFSFSQNEFSLFIRTSILEGGSLRMICLAVRPLPKHCVAGVKWYRTIQGLYLFLLLNRFLLFASAFFGKPCPQILVQNYISEHNKLHQLHPFGVTIANAVRIGYLEVVGIISFIFN
ncbi:hypothetical protein ACJX0J_022508, partial [Zea mays]